ncbi:hypothetical protein [Paenibacillus sp. 1P07SE]|uniref:hypothetical protein n=1 Tax=Paenibacillus sp. 1P07SE TaxID=3132209 RepID=UPI0039A5A68F
MNRLAFVMLLLMLFCLGCELDIEPPKGTMTIEEKLEESEASVNHVIQEIPLPDIEEALAVYDDEAFVNVDYLKLHDGAWTLQNRATMSKDHSFPFTWSFHFFRERDQQQRAVAKHHLAYGLVWDEAIARMVMVQEGQAYEARIVDTRYDYRLWYYLKAPDEQLEEQGNYGFEAYDANGELVFELK